MARAELGDLGGNIERLDERGRIVRVRPEIDPVHDLAGLAYRLEGRGAAVLLEQALCQRRCPAPRAACPSN